MVSFAERQVRADGFTIRYVEAGDGPVLCCFHGAGGLRLSRAHELLAATHRVVAFEAPGFGTSPANHTSGSLRELAGTMAAAMGELGIDRAGVWGTSFGGKLACWLAADHPEQLDALVLESPAAIRPEGATVRTPDELAALLYHHPERQAAAEPLSGEDAAKQQELTRRLIGPPREPDLEAALAELAVATLVVFGSEDRLTPPELGRHSRRLLPECHFVIVWDAAHAVGADRPEAFAATVADFLARKGEFVVRQESGLRYP